VLKLGEKKSKSPSASKVSLAKMPAITQTAQAAERTLRGDLNKEQNGEKGEKEEGSSPLAIARGQKKNVREGGAPPRVRWAL